MADSPDMQPLPPENQSISFHLAALLGARSDMPNRREYLFVLAASVVFILGTLGVLGYSYLEPVRQDLAQATRGLTGPRGPAVFIALQALDAVLLVWSLPLEMDGGFWFGLPRGVLYSIRGHALGATFAFFVGRWLNKHWLTRLERSLRGLEKYISSLIIIL